MNIPELKAEIARQNLTIPKLADKIHISKKTLYSRVNGETNFSLKEISAIAEVLKLSKDKIFFIFFANEVA
jgi:DNA-binding XRE family transcriptional regulator